MVFHTLLFCASIYHKVGLAVFGAARSLGGFQFYNTLMISTLDRFLFLHYELCGTRLSSEPKQQLILCYLLIEARCFNGIKKNQHIFFNMGSFSRIHMRFFVLEDKKIKFAAFRVDIFSSPVLGRKTL